MTDNEIIKDEYAGKRIKIRGTESYGTVIHTMDERASAREMTKRYLITKMDDGSELKLGIEEVRFQ